MFRFVVTVAIMLSLGACATYEEKFEASFAEIPKEDLAFVAGRFTVSCRPKSKGRCQQHFPFTGVYFRSLDNPEIENTIRAINDGQLTVKATEFDEVDAEHGTKSFYFCRPIPPGEYEFYQHSYYSAYESYSVAEGDAYSLAFSAPPGSLIYVGHLMAASWSEDAMFGTFTPIPGVLRVSPADELLDEAVQKCPPEVRARAPSMNGFRAADTAPNPFVEDM